MLRTNTSTHTHSYTADSPLPYNGPTHLQNDIELSSLLAQRRVAVFLRAQSPVAFSGTVYSNLALMPVFELTQAEDIHCAAAPIIANRNYAHRYIYPITRTTNNVKFMIID